MGCRMTTSTLKLVLSEQATPDLVAYIEEETVFDLMFELCNLLHESGFPLSSLRLEDVLDAFLIETGKISAPPPPAPTLKTAPRTLPKPLPARNDPPGITRKRSATPPRRKAAVHPFPRQPLTFTSGRAAQDRCKIDNIFLDYD